MSSGFFGKLFRLAEITNFFLQFAPIRMRVQAPRTTFTRKMPVQEFVWIRLFIRRQHRANPTGRTVIMSRTWTDADASASLHRESKTRFRTAVRCISRSRYEAISRGLIKRGPLAGWKVDGTRGTPNVHKSTSQLWICNLRDKKLSYIRRYLRHAILLKSVQGRKKWNIPSCCAYYGRLCTMQSLGWTAHHHLVHALQGRAKTDHILFPVAHFFAHLPVRLSTCVNYRSLNRRLMNFL